MRTRIRSVAAGVAAAALVTTAVIGMSSASAEVIDINAPITGSLVINGKDAALPAGAAVTGTLDDETGELALTMTAPDGVLMATVAGIGEVAVNYRLTNPESITGTVDAEGTVAANGSFRLDIISADIGGGVVLPLEPCTFAPITMDFTGTMVDRVLTLSAPAFEIPGTEDECGGLAETINTEVAGSNNSAELVIDFDAELTTPTTPTTPEPTVTVPAPPAEPAPVNGGQAPGAKPVAGAANYTG